MKKSYEERIEKLRKKMETRGIDTMMVFSAENRYYLSGFNAEDTQLNESSGALIIGMDKLYLATDSRFETQAEIEAPLYKSVIYKKGIASVLDSVFKDISSKKVGFESDRLSFHTFSMIDKELKGNYELIESEDIMSELRIVKNEDEIAVMKEAMDLAEKAYLETVKALKKGMSEREIAWILEQNIRNLGCDGLSFSTIIAYGKNSALPHAIPGDTKIENGAPLLFDWGAKYNGYCSDTTRTLFLGEPDKTFLKVYDTVLEAHMRAMNKIKEGASTMDVDDEARRYINENGFEGKFGHGLGHGVGMEVHEAPRLSPIKDSILKEGMVVTVEPGIYLPEWGGIRLENVAVVRKDRAEVINKLSFEDNIVEL